MLCQTFARGVDELWGDVPQVGEIVEEEGVAVGGFRGHGAQLPRVRYTDADGKDVDALLARQLSFRYRLLRVHVGQTISNDDSCARKEEQLGYSPYSDNCKLEEDLI